MRWFQARHQKTGRIAAIAVALALVGHALLMAGGGHPISAATHSTHASAAHSSATPTSTLRTSHHAAHAHARSIAGSAIDTGSVARAPPAGDVPTGDRTAWCGDVLTLAWPQPPPTRDLGSGHVLPPLTLDMGLLAPSERRAVSCRLGPTAPPGTVRALLQIYRL